MYAVVPHPHPRPAVLAVAPRHRDIADAVAAMGDGAVLDPATGRLAAFHERHLPILLRRAEPART